MKNGKPDKKEKKRIATAILLVLLIAMVAGTYDPSLIGFVTRYQQPNGTDQGKDTFHEELCVTTNPVSTASSITTSTNSEVPNAPEFGSLAAVAAILLSAPAFAYLIVKRRETH